MVSVKPSLPPSLVSIAARHADNPHHDARCDRARKSLDRHLNCVLAAYMASGN